MTIWEHIDLNEIKRVSNVAYNDMQKIYASYGREYAEMALNAVIDLMMDANLCSDDYWKRSEREAKNTA